MAYERISPGDPERRDHLFATIAWAIASWSERSGRKKYKIDDFLIRFKQPIKRGDWRDLMTKMTSWSGMQNAAVDKRKKKKDQK